MAITIPTANLFHDTRRKLLGTEKYPVKLTVYYLGTKKRYKLPYNLTKDEWQKINSKKLRDEELKNTKTKLDYYCGKKFNVCIKDIEDPFTFQKFEDLYFKENQPIQKNVDVYTLFQSFVDRQNKDGRVGNAQIYENAMKNFKEIRKRLNFEEVTVDFLNTYEKELLAKGNSLAYIAINLRCLRSIYNQAIALKMVNQDSYPFSRDRNDKLYKIRQGKSTPKALSTVQLKQLKNHIANTPAQQKALDFWLFSFYCNGMNFKDIGLLQYKNINGNKIEFLRAKTEYSTLSSEKIQFVIIPEIQAIIDKYANPFVTPETHLFDILKPGLSPKQERARIQSFTRNLRKHLKNVSNDLKFGFTISAAWARHSFATYLKRSGTSYEVIGEALGHSSMGTTKNYLDSLDDEALNNTANLLSNI